jgi:PAS domain S-box-containing protein
MPLPPLDHLTLEITELLAGDDAKRNLELCLTRLAELGLRQQAEGADLTLESHGQKLALAGGTPELRNAVGPLLRLGLRLVAEQVEHRKTRERLELLSAASFEGILVHVNGVVIDTNQRLAEMLRATPEQLLGPETMQRSVAPEDLPDVMNRVATGYEGAYTITGVRRDGSQFRAELQSKQGRLGDRPVRIAAVRDVTEREHTLSLLRESEQQLSSGYQAQTAAERLEPGAFQVFLPKPYGMSELFGALEAARTMVNKLTLR